MKKHESSIQRLTVNSVATAMMHGGSGSLRSLAMGIFLSLFLVSAMVMSIHGIVLANRNQTAQKVGWEDFILFDYPEKTDADLKATGHFDEIGHAAVTASLPGSQRYLGFYDDAAAQLMNRRVIEGRMPESAGEIALDQDVLEYLRADISIGENISIELTPIDGLAEERQFTIVGVLMGQPLSTNYTRVGSERITELPSMLTCAAEPAFATGRTAVHRIMTLAKGATRSQAMEDNWTKYDDWLFAVYPDGRLLNVYDISNELSSLLNTTTLVLVLLGLSLALCAGVGVAQAMEGQLMKRVEEIGMLRAVGATRRQIRRIFGRQTWLLALGIAPFSLAAGCAFAWGLSRMLPETVLFRPSWIVLAPIAILSVLCVWLSSSLPLRRASRIMPMSVIRDTAILRKARRVKSHTDFRLAWLLVKRQTLLYPTRQLGAALMAALTLLCAGFGVLGISGFLQGSGIGFDYSITNQEFLWTNPPFSDLDAPGRFLTESDISQLRALPHVRTVNTNRNMNVTLLADKATDYLTYTNPYLSGEEVSVRAGWYEGEDNEQIRRRAMLAQAYIGTEKELAEYPLVVATLTPETLDILREMVAEGRVDVEALDAGREVLVYAPSIIRAEDGKGGMSEGTDYAMRHLAKGEVVTRRWENDFFHAGSALDFVQLIGEANSEETIRITYEESDEEYAAWLDKCERHDVHVTVGAVLNASGEYDETLPFYGNSCLITTEKGMLALGLRPKEYYAVQIYLDGAVDTETGEFISDRVNAIAARAEDAYVYDGVAFVHSQRQALWQTILTFAAMTLMFSSVTVGMASGNASRRIRADQRMIGMLRAVGADARVFIKCYGAQIGSGLIIGLVAALVIITLFMTLVMYNVASGTMLLTFAVMSVLAAMCIICCFIALRLKIRETIGRSIVENIKEL